MLKFFRNIIPKDAPPPETGSGYAPGPSTQQHTNVKRELIRVVLKDTLRLQGIPYDWLSCEIIVIPRGPSEEDLHIQLVLMKWHETFLRYAPALERQLLRGLDRFDPQVDHSKYIISWRFSRDCGCPFTVMPPAPFWSHEDKPVTPVEEEAPSILDRRHARRPPKAETPANNTQGLPRSPPPESDDGQDYESTQLSPLK